MTAPAGAGVSAGFGGCVVDIRFGPKADNGDADHDVLDVARWVDVDAVSNVRLVKPCVRCLEP